MCSLCLALTLTSTFFFKCSIIPFYLHINDRENKVKFNFSTQKMHHANSINLMSRGSFKNWCFSRIKRLIRTKKIAKNWCKNDPKEKLCTQYLMYDRFINQVSVSNPKLWLRFKKKLPMLVFWMAFVCCFAHHLSWFIRDANLCSSGLLNNDQPFQYDVINSWNRLIEVSARLIISQDLAWKFIEILEIWRLILRWLAQPMANWKCHELDQQYDLIYEPRDFRIDEWTRYFTRRVAVKMVDGAVWRRRRRWLLSVLW